MSSEAVESALVISVSDILPGDDNKSVQFKIVSEFREDGKGKSSTVMRTHQQLSWLQQKLVENHKNEIVPVLPDAPTASSLSDKEYVEKKRRQLDRFLVRVASRPSFVADEELRTFLTSGLPQNESNDGRKMGAKALLSALKQEHGIRLYRPTAFHDDEDDMDFEKRRMFVLQSERDFKIALDQIGGCIRHRGQLGKALATAFSSFSGFENGDKVGEILTRVNEFGAAQETTHRHQAREEVFHLGDILLDYRNSVDALKQLLNNRTELLSEVDNSIKATQKAVEGLEKLGKKFSEASAEYLAASADVEKLQDRQKELQAQYKAFRRDIACEFERFSKEKATDFHMALDHFVRTQLNSEQEKLDALMDLSSFLHTVKV